MDGDTHALARSQRVTRGLFSPRAAPGGILGPAPARAGSFVVRTDRHERIGGIKISGLARFSAGPDRFARIVGTSAAGTGIRQRPDDWADWRSAPSPRHRPAVAAARSPWP